jgi:hypothetical protein
MAGFFPFAYEFGSKDTFLGSENLFFTWYSLFKERAARLLPEGECHTKLIMAIGIVVQSRERAMKGNVGKHIRERWIERERVKLSADVRRGWVREDGAEGMVPFAKEDDESLEDEVLKALGLIECSRSL